MPCTGTVLVSVRWVLHVVNRTRTSCYFSWKRCWLVFSYHGELSRFQVSKYIKYSAHTVCISLYIYCLITCNINSLLNVPKISRISRKISQVSRFPAKSPDSRNKFVLLPKQPLFRGTQREILRKRPKNNNKAWMKFSDSILSILGDCWKKIICSSLPARLMEEFPASNLTTCNLTYWEVS